MGPSRINAREPFYMNKAEQQGRRSGFSLDEWKAGFPNYPIVFGLILLWGALFTFLGNSTFGYSDSPSLFGWLHYAYSIDVENQHGYIIPVVVGILLYLNRERLLSCTKEVFWPAILVVLLAVALHLVGYVVQQIRLSIVGFVLGLYGITGLYWGRQWMKITLFPFALFAFCIPLGSYAEYITFPLRMLVTKISVGFSHYFLGIEVIREGTQIMGANRSFQYDVAPACSGIRSLFALTALATVYGYLTFSVVWKRAVMIAMAIPLAVVGNSIRIIAVIVAGETVGQAAGAAIEQKLGFVTFFTAMVGLFAVGKLFEGKAKAQETVREERDDRVPSEEQRSSPVSVLVTRRAKLPAVLCVVLMLGLTGFLAAWGNFQKLGEPGVVLVDEPMYFVRTGETIARPDDLVSSKSIGLPERVGGYVSTNLPLQEIVVTKLPQDTTYGQKRYVADDGFYVDNLAVLMGTDRTSIHQPQYCLVGSGWKIDDQNPATIKLSQPIPYELPVMKLTTSKKYQASDGSEVDVSGVYLYWFVSGSNLTEQHGDRMWSMAKNLMLNQQLERWAYITVFSPCRPGMESQTFERLKEFIRKSVPEYQVFPARPDPS